MTYRRQSIPQSRFPFVEDFEEFRCLCIADTSLLEPLSTALLEDGVDRLRDALVRPHPVPVAAAEDGVLDALELVTLEALDPFKEVRGVIGRFA